MPSDAETVAPVDTLADVDAGDPKGTTSTYYDDGDYYHYVDPDALAAAVDRASHPRDEDDLGAQQWYDSILPMDKPPSFGEPLDDCGDYIPASKHFCTDCLGVHDMPRNCLRYDCPDHWAHAIRRRAAGCKHAAGLAPQMGALMGYLQASRDAHQLYHHLVVDVFGGADGGHYIMESDNPRERGWQLIRELMDTLGIQGVPIYHAWRGDDDDRGAWKARIGSGRDWDDDVRDELHYDPHFHIIGVGPKLDLTDIGDFHAETGWVINRIADGDDVSIYDDDAMVDALLYSLSHAGVYETDSGQRRLAARMKGPDVNRVVPDRQTQHRYKSLVNDAAEQTLGIPAPDMECDNDVPDQYEVGGHDHLPDVELTQGSPLPDAWQPDAIAPDGTRTDPPGLQRSASSNVDGVAGMSSSPTTLDDQTDDLATSSSSSSSSAFTPVTGDDAETHDDGGDQDDGTDYCGGHLLHISQAGEYLLDRDQRKTAPYADDLERAYREYVDWCRQQNLDPADTQREVTEFDDATPGRTSKVLDELGSIGDDPPD